MEFLEIDGSFGEGGGQTLRTAVAFSAILSRPIRVVKIRSGRRNPGLKRQHASTLRVIGEIFGADLHGAEEGSQEITFAPGAPRVRTISFDMRTAGSITLALQAVIPAVALTGSTLALDIVGGTDVPWSPTFDYLDRVAREAYALMGINFTSTCHRRGFYPNGGGKVSATIDPSSGVVPVELTESSGRASVAIVSRCARLPRRVAERQMESAKSALSAIDVSLDDTIVLEDPSESPGSSILVSTKVGGCILGADAIGARGRPAEDVGADAAHRFATSMRTGACVDPNLADMMAPLLSLGRGVSRIRTSEITTHLRTGAHIAQIFTNCDYAYENTNRGSLITISPR